MDANESHLNLPERIHTQWSENPALGRSENPFYIPLNTSPNGISFMKSRIFPGSLIIATGKTSFSATSLIVGNNVTSPLKFY